MKIGMIIVAAIGIFSIAAYAEEDNCMSRYQELLDIVENSIELSEADKAEFTPQLVKALKLCKEGKKKEASKIVEKLRHEAALKTVFSTYDSN